MISTKTYKDQIILSILNNINNLEDREEFLEYLSDNVELIITGDKNHIPLAGVYKGREGLTEYFNKLNCEAEIDEVIKQDVLIEGDFIDLHIRKKGKFIKSGSRFDLEWVYALELKDSKIVKITLFYDTHCFQEAYYSDSKITVSDIKNPDDVRFNPKDSNDYRPLLEKIYKAFYYDQDIETFFSGIDKDVQFVFKGDEENTPYVGLYQGHEGISKFLENIIPNFTATELKFLNSVQQGNRINYRIYEEGLSTPTGKSYKITVLQSFLIEDNKIVEFKTYNDSYAVGQSYIKE